MENKRIRAACRVGQAVGQPLESPVAFGLECRCRAARACGTRNYADSSDFSLELLFCFSLLRCVAGPL